MKQKRLISLLLVILLSIGAFSPLSFSASTITHSMDIISTGLSLAVNVIIGPDGKLYISEYNGGNILRVDRDGQNKETFASGLSQPIGMCFDSGGNLYVAQHAGSRVVKIQPDGTKTTIKDGTGFLTGLTIDDSNSKLYAVDYTTGKILKMNLDGTGSSDFVTGLGATNIIGMTIDGNNNLYVADRAGGKVKKIAPDATVTDFITGLSTPTWVTLGDDGYFYVSLGSRKIEKYDVSGQKVDEFLTPSTIGHPWGTYIDQTGCIYYQTLGSMSCKIIGTANTTDKTHLTLTLNTTLPEMTLDSNAFTISGVASGSTVTQAVTSGSSIFLTLNQNISYTDSYPKVSYAKTGTNNIVTSGAAIEFDNFTNMPVKNNVLGVSSVSSISNVNVSFGTDLSTAKAQLPTTVNVSLSNATTTPSAITWNNGTPAYNGNVAGNYVFSGTIFTSENVSNPSNLSASATVVVSPAVLSTDATLSGISLSSGTLTFDASAREYSVSVPNGTTSITITPAANEAHATMTINGSALVSGSGTVNLNVGSNAVVVLVTAQNGTTTETYTLNVQRQSAPILSADATLSGISLSAGSLTFDASAREYSVSVPNGTTSITITPAANEAHATMTINGSALVSGSGTVNLNVGSNAFVVLVTAQNGTTTETYTLNVQRQNASAPETPSQGGGGGGEDVVTVKPKASEGASIVIINGQEQSAGKESKTTVEGRTVVTVEVENKVIESKIEEVMKNSSPGSKNMLQIPVQTQNANMIKVQLTGDIVKKLETNAFDVSVKSGNIEYVIPAGEFTISKVAESLAILEKDLKDIKIEVQITNLPQDVVNKYSDIAKGNGAELVFPPVSFDVIAKTTRIDGKTGEVSINKFSNYVERVIEVPSNIDTSKVTTGIVFNAVGTYSHVPTEVFQKDSKWYARISSVTNSSYSLLWNPITVKSVEKHWSKNTVNDMASRLVIFNTESFDPDKAITRGDFAEYLVRALGLYREGLKLENKFKDVSTEGDRELGILIANEYGLVTGYTDGTFRPDALITREEAMMMCQRAMKISKLVGTDASRYEVYTDFNQVSAGARESVKDVLAAHVFNGTTTKSISPNKNITYAEATQAIKNLLVASGLINK